MRTRTVLLGIVAAIAVAGIAIVAFGGDSTSPASVVGNEDGAVRDTSVAVAGEENLNALPITGAPSTGDTDHSPAGGVSDSAYDSTSGEQQAGGGPSTIDRKIVRNATLDLKVDDVLATVAQIEAEGTSSGGYVAQSTLTTVSPATEDEPARQTAVVQIRVPADQYDAVMARLRGFAKEVTSEQASTSEVTEEYTDLQSQLRNLQATEERYLELMAKAETITDILTVQDRLAGVRAEIESTQGRINLLDNLSDMATITVNLALPAVITPPVTPETESWAQQAWNDAWEGSQDALEQMGRIAIIAGVVMVWIVVPASVLGFGWWLFGGKRGKGAATSS